MKAAARAFSDVFPAWEDSGVREERLEAAAASFCVGGHPVCQPVELIVQSRHGIEEVAGNSSRWIASPSAVFLPLPEAGRQSRSRLRDVREPKF